MDSSNASSSKEENVKHLNVDSLPPDELIVKYKSLLSIAQKAKQAKDDAVNKNISLQEENSSLFNKLCGLESQLKTSQEMLEILTQQKLNLAMELDDLRKGKNKNLDDIKMLTGKCEVLEVEAESYKRQYDKMIYENELLLKKLESTEQQLQADGNKALQLQMDIKKLQENNDDLKHLWTIESKEKKDLQELFHSTTNKMQDLQNQHSHWFSYLSKKYDLVTDDVDKWIACIEDSSVFNQKSLKEAECDENGTEEMCGVNILKSKIDSLLAEKEASECELNHLRQQNKKVLSELNTMNNERDKMVLNLENVRIETHQLIENSEKLSQEIEILKTEKQKLESEMSCFICKANITNQEFASKLEQSNFELENFMTKSEALRSELKMSQDEVMHLNSIASEMTLEIADLKSVIEKKNVEIQSLESDKIYLIDDLKYLKGINACPNCKIEPSDNASIQSCNLTPMKPSNEECEEAKNKNVEPLQITELSDLNVQEQSSEMQCDIPEQSCRDENQDSVCQKISGYVDDESYGKVFYIEKLKEYKTALEEKHLENKELKEKLSSLLLCEEKLLKSEKHCDDLTLIIKGLQMEIQTSKDARDKYQLLVDDWQAKQEITDQNYFKELEHYKHLIIEAGKTKEILLFDLEQCKNNLSEKHSEIERLNFLIKENDALYKVQYQELIELKEESIEKKRYLDESNESESKFLDLIERNNKLLLEKDLEIEKFLNNIKSIDSELEKCKTELSESQQKENQLMSKIKQLENQVNELNATVEKHKNENLALNNRIQWFSEDLQQKNTLTDSLERKLSEYEAKNNDLVEVTTKLKSENYTINQQLNDMVSNVKHYEETTTAITNELKDYQSKMQSKSFEYEESSRLWNARLTVFKGGIVGLKQSMEDIARQFNEIKKHFGVQLPNVVEEITGVITRFTEQTIVSSKLELLAEMQHMNQALKERGELISKLQENISENKGRIKKLTDENLELQQANTDINEQLSLKEDLIKSKDSSIKELEAEMKKLKDLHESSTVSEGDVLSSCAINKTDEISRLKDIEESFEDKYVKLKFMAVKLKKRLSDTSHNLEVERGKMASEKQELQEKILSLSAVAKTAQKVQATCDKMLDEIEEEKRKNQEISALLELSKKSEESLKLQIVNLESEVNKISTLQNQLELLEMSLKESNKEIKTLQKFKADAVLKSEELNREKCVLENKLSEMNKSLEGALQQSRVNNVLELEMQNYEKAIADLSLQLNSEKESSKANNKEIEAIKSLNSGLEEQIKILKEKLHLEQEGHQHVNEQVTLLHSKNEKLQSDLDNQIAKTDALTKELHCEKNKCETLVLECSNLSLEFKKQEVDLHLQLDTLQKYVHNLETSLSNTKQDLLTSRSEVENVRNDFENYRIRAQSVLAKQKGDTISQGEKEAREQLEYMNIEMNGLRQRLESTVCEFEALKSESSFYLSEKERTDKRLEELNKIIKQKTAVVDKINQEYRSYKISQETLIQCYKTEMEEKDKVYKISLEELQSRIEELNSQTKEKENDSPETESVHDYNDRSSAQLPALGETDVPLEREDGEGSESVPSPKGTRQTMLVPLDILLHSPIEDECKVSVLMERIVKLQNELSSYEVRTRHLSSLLSEAEKDSARNSQLNSVLKEEVRRLERSIERQPHAQNTEYLKNIIFKFLTLQSCDERTRLVPVLDTILKLSPEEKQQLKLIAKGETTSWGNYLPYWTGL